MCPYTRNNDKCSSCFASRNKLKNVRLFRFPKHEKRCKQWVLACQLKKLFNLPAELLYKKYRLCSQHFTDEDYTSAQMNRLKPTACPSKFDFGEKSIVSKLKENLKLKLARSVKDNDSLFSGEIIDDSESENMTDSVQVLMVAPNGKTNFLVENEYRIPGSSVPELLKNEVRSNKVTVNEAVLLDISMNETFYSPEHRKVLTNSISKSCNSQSNGSNIPENNIQSKEKLKAESSFKALKKQCLDAEIKATTAKSDSPEQHNAFTNCLSKSCNSQSKDSNIPESNIQSKENLNAESSFKALKKQWLDAEIKAATAKRDYYEMKRVMLTKLQNDLDFENSSKIQISSAIRYIKVHLNKEELTSKIEKKMLKQKLEEAKNLAYNCETEYCDPKLEILSSSDDM